ncbi:hypothetical protein [Streptomyces xantholiticus]|uniref:hypothetical protein n=1 Tax=Streptomyces xantholiticus TaxID=68285 RepID=UPI00198C0DD7|nr:hypothetical protein [Streptomyces xantholiticus]GGW72162.1 hypothetical protein GCM10010381_66070 [Streptomyces xantholiticus]
MSYSELSYFAYSVAAGHARFVELPDVADLDRGRTGTDGLADTLYEAVSDTLDSISAVGRLQVLAAPP